MTLRQLPLSERPREKLMHFGPEFLSDAELLAILINKGTRGCNALELARELLNDHGSLNGIFSLSYEQACQHRGLGSAKYCQLQATVELHRRILSAPIKPKTTIAHPKEAENLLIARLRGHEQEVFACLFLDTRHQVIRFEKLFYGSLKNAEIHPREIARRALQYNAAAIIVAHNHPSGGADPSQADRESTDALIEALALLDIRLLDHFVIGETETASFAALGLLTSNSRRIFS